MATLNELKTQITNANALGIEKITSKGGTVAQDADTVAIMGAIDSIPAGGGSTPTVVNSITWDGNTEGLESVILGQDGQGMDRVLYHVSDDVLPINMDIDGDTFECSSEFRYTVTTVESGVATDAARSGAVVMKGEGVDIMSFYGVDTCLCVFSPSSMGQIAVGTGTWMRAYGA